jgi:hypothetical protein
MELILYQSELVFEISSDVTFPDWVTDFRRFEATWWSYLQGSLCPFVFECSGRLKVNNYIIYNALKL